MCDYNRVPNMQAPNNEGDVIQMHVAGPFDRHFIDDTQRNLHTMHPSTDVYARTPGINVDGYAGVGITPPHNTVSHESAAYGLTAGFVSSDESAGVQHVTDAQRYMMGLHRPTSGLLSRK